MVSLTRSLSRPRALVLMWSAALLAPFTWSAALGLLFSMIDEACMTGSRSLLWVVAITCILLAAAPAVLVAPWRRSVDASTAAGERARLILDLAIAGSLIFALVMVLTAAPIVMLDTCRT